MTKDVIVKIKSIHTSEGEDDSIQIMMPGQFYSRNGKMFVCYEEADEETNSVIKSMLKFNNKGLEMIKKGESNTHLKFEKDKKNYSYYNTPIGALFMGVNTKSFEYEEDENEIRTIIEYSLEVNDEKISQCKISINIVSCENCEELV